VASFDRRGEYIYTGDAKGRILIQNSIKLNIVESFRIIVGTFSTTALKSIEFARRGEYVVVYVFL
jgi:COMPASS component SWD1